MRSEEQPPKRTAKAGKRAVVARRERATIGKKAQSVPTIGKKAKGAAKRLAGLVPEAAQSSQEYEAEVCMYVCYVCMYVCR